LEHWLELVGVAVTLYIATNLDDAFLLIALFSDPSLRPAHIVAGQYAGMFLLYAASVVASLVGLLVPQVYLGLLGLIPMLIGVAGLRDAAGPARESDDVQRTGRGGIASVAAITVASGGDNIAVYTPVFAVQTMTAKLLIGGVFAIMIALWVAGARWLTRHPALGAPLRKYGRVMLPFVFIAIGIWVFIEAKSYELLLP
jgi:cadmium resistance protein CadD (predicted permease)